MSELHILNLGAGVQSTTLYLMFMRGDIKPQIDYAIFADTGEEPEAVYRTWSGCNRSMGHRSWFAPRGD